MSGQIGRSTAAITVWLGLLVTVAATPLQVSFDALLQEAEAAKARGDMAAMEQALLRAHALAPGTEYTWRSLAWAQMHQGKWRESLANAWENIRRNGKTSWSLSQLYESAMAAGDTHLAGKVLAEEEKLPRAARNRSLDHERQAYRAATKPTAYDLTWNLRVADYKLQKGELVINVPFRRHLWQRARIWIEGAKGYRIQAIGGRDVMFANPGGAEELRLRARVRHTPRVRGAAFAERTRECSLGPGMTLLLGPFRNRTDYDPADAELQAIIQPMRSGTPGQRVQAVLDWLRANVRYVDGYPDDLASILKNRKGVCHHQSNLMVAMCRALGVPAMVAHGIRLGGGNSAFENVVASHGWVEVYLNGHWEGVEPLNPNSLRYFDSGYLIVDATGRGPGPGNDHFLMFTPDGRHIEGIQGVPVSGRSWIEE